MAQDILISSLIISPDIENTDTFSIAAPGGVTVNPSTCTKTDLENSLVVTVYSDVVNSLTFTISSGVCAELVSEEVTWDLPTPAPSTPAPLPTNASTLFIHIPNQN